LIDHPGRIRHATDYVYFVGIVPLGACLQPARENCWRGSPYCCHHTKSSAW
jgi:hypothetical protein